MTKPNPNRVARAYMQKEAAMQKEAGEVIFKKDRGGDLSQWAYADHNPSDRKIPDGFLYSPRNQKPLAEVLRSSLAALGHTLSAYSNFAKLKSSKISPDGNLGGRGYIMKIADMRKQYMNCVEALSALSDTLYDEIHAQHWAVLSRQDPQTQADVSDLIQNAEKIRDNPQEWAEDEMREEFEEGHKSQQKQARSVIASALSKNDVEKLPNGSIVALPSASGGVSGAFIVMGPGKLMQFRDYNPDYETDPNAILPVANWMREENATEIHLVYKSNGTVPTHSTMMRHFNAWYQKFLAERRGKSASLESSEYVRDRLATWVDQLPGGLGDDFSPEDFDEFQLDQGVKVEMEHTENPELALEIAMDHLTEDPLYYEKLQLIEGDHQ